MDEYVPFTTGGFVRVFTKIIANIDRIPLTAAHVDNTEDYGKNHYDMEKKEVNS